MIGGRKFQWMTLKLRGVHRVMASTIQSTVPYSLPVFPGGITDAEPARVVDEVKG